MRIRIRIRIQYFFKLRIRIPDPQIPDPDPAFDDLKLKKIYSWKFNFNFLIKNCNLLIPWPPFKGRQSYRRRLQSSKENIQHFKTWKFCTLFYFFGLFLPSLIRIRIRNLNEHTDPDPATQINADPCGSATLVQIWSLWLLAGKLNAATDLKGLSHEMKWLLMTYGIWLVLGLNRGRGLLLNFAGALDIDRHR